VGWPVAGTPDDVLKLGELVGAEVPPFVGTRVGLLVGTLWGANENGALVGAVDGLDVGALVGEIVGPTVGVLFGDTDGAVGAIEEVEYFPIPLSFTRALNDLFKGFAVAPFV